jgi:hypothetical protein
VVVVMLVLQLEMAMVIEMRMWAAAAPRLAVENLVLVLVPLALRQSLRRLLPVAGAPVPVRMLRCWIPAHRSRGKGL